MKKVKLIMFSLLFSLAGYAQLEQTKVVITDGLENGDLKKSIEQNITDFLVACNEAVMNGEKPDVKDMLTSDARKSLKAMWKTSPMSCPVSKIEDTITITE